MHASLSSRGFATLKIFSVEQRRPAILQQVRRVSIGYAPLNEEVS
jgi:hypothetical protein